MTSQALLTIQEYLDTSFEDGDLEYVDGELIENNVGEIDHSDIQSLILGWFLNRRRKYGVYPLVEVRTRVSPTRYRLPDIAVILGERPAGRVLTDPPFLVIEILSPEDRVSRMESRIDDFIRFGVRFIWLIDPKTLTGHIYTAERRIAVDDGVFRTEDPKIEMNLAELRD